MESLLTLFYHTKDANYEFFFPSALLFSPGRLKREPSCLNTIHRNGPAFELAKGMGVEDD